MRVEFFSLKISHPTKIKSYCVFQGTGRPSKLEKADILELTVQHLQVIHSQTTGVSSNYPESGEEDSPAPASVNVNIKPELVPTATVVEPTSNNDNLNLNHQCLNISRRESEEGEDEELVLVIKRSSIGFLQNQSKGSSLVFKSGKGGRGQVHLLLEPQSQSRLNDNLIETSVSEICSKQEIAIWRPW